MIRFSGRSISGPYFDGHDTEDLLKKMYMYSDSPEFVQWSYAENGPTQWVLIAEYETYAAPIGFLDKKPEGIPHHTGANYSQPSPRSSPDRAPACGAGGAGSIPAEDTMTENEYRLAVQENTCPAIVWSGLGSHRCGQPIIEFLGKDGNLVIHCSMDHYMSLKVVGEDE